jgi:hypothetical protein
MHAFRVVMELDVLEYLLLGLLRILVCLSLDEFRLQCLEKGLGDSIVVGIARTRDRLRDAMVPECLPRRP